MRVSETEDEVDLVERVLEGSGSETSEGLELIESVAELSDGGEFVVESHRLALHRNALFSH